MSKPATTGDLLRRAHGGHLVELSLRAEGLARSLRDTASVVLMQRGETTAAHRRDWTERAEALLREMRALDGTGASHGSEVG